MSQFYLQLQINKPRHKEGKGSTKEADTNSLQTRLEEVAAGQGWVDGRVKNGNHDQDEDSIGDLTQTQRSEYQEIRHSSYLNVIWF